MRLVRFTVANKTLVQGKVHGCKIQKDHLTLALAINMTSVDKLKLVIIYKSRRPRWFGRWLPTSYVWSFAKQIGMDDIIFEIWMMSLKVHFTSQKRKVLWRKGRKWNVKVVHPDMRCPFTASLSSLCEHEVGPA